jgi:hypothetical protein
VFLPRPRRPRAEDYAKKATGFRLQASGKASGRLIIGGAEIKTIDGSGVYVGPMPNIKSLDLEIGRPPASLPEACSLKPVAFSFFRSAA